MNTRVMLADDHHVLRDGLRQVIEAEREFQVVGEATDGRTAVDLAERLSPDVVVMDIWMPALSGIEATRRIKASRPSCHILVLSQHDSYSHVEEALQAGASGYVIKTSSSGELIDALRAVCAGKCYLAPDIAQQLVGALGRPRGSAGSLAALTGREREVLQLIAECLSSKEIATELGVSVRTVEAHRASVMEKLAIHKVAGLVRFAIREGLVAP